MATALLTLIRLHHLEVNIVPGDNPTQGVRKPGQVGFGEALVTVFNPTDQEQDIDVDFLCEDFPDLRDWVTLRPLAPKVATTAKDRPRDQNRKYTVPVAGNQSRDIAIHFKVGLESRARAGVYEFKVHARIKHGSGSGVRELEQDALGVAIIRPFFRWRVETNPSVAERGPLRRRQKFNVRVINEGNDWLYVDVKSKEHPNLWVLVENKVIAVPPPGSDGAPTSRNIVVNTRTRLRFLCGEVRPTEIPVTFTRKDAPSVAPLADGAVGGFDPAGLGQPVLTTEAQVAQSPNSQQVGRVDYEPWIPTSVEGCWNQLKSRVRSTIMTVIGLYVLYQLVGFALTKQAKDLFAFTTTSYQATKDKPQVELKSKGPLFYGLPSIELETINPKHVVSNISPTWSEDSKTPGFRKWVIDLSKVMVEDQSVIELLDGSENNELVLRPRWSRILFGQVAMDVRIRVGSQKEERKSSMAIARPEINLTGIAGESVVKALEVSLPPDVPNGTTIKFDNAGVQGRVVDVDKIEVTLTLESIGFGSGDIGGTILTKDGEFSIKIPYRFDDSPKVPDESGTNLESSSGTGSGGASGGGSEQPDIQPEGTPSMLTGITESTAVPTWKKVAEAEERSLVSIELQARYVLAHSYLLATGQGEAKLLDIAENESLRAFRASVESADGLIGGLSRRARGLTEEQQLLVKLAAAAFNRACSRGKPLSGSAARLQNEITGDHKDLIDKVVPGLFD